MDALQNPFTPGAGIQPPELTGRDDFLRQAEIAIQRTVAGRVGKSFVAVGLRGVGKTVILNRIANLAKNYNCKYSLIEMHEDKSLPAVLVPALRKILFEISSVDKMSATIKKAFRVLKSFVGSLKVQYGDIEVGIDIDPEIGIADNKDIEIDLQDVFQYLGEAAKSSNTAIILILDEMQYLKEKEMSGIIMALHKTAQQQLPVLLVGAGLPLLVGKMGKSKSYAERLFDFPEIGALNYDEACDALIKPAEREQASFSADALSEIFTFTQGYPYFIQEWGYTCWNIAEGSTITLQDVKNATVSVTKKLDAGFFRVRFDRLTRREKQYLRAMAELGEGPYKTGDVAELLNIGRKTVAPVRANLIQKGMIFSPSYGDMAFTVPLFDQHIRRVMAFSTWNTDE